MTNGTIRVLDHADVADVVRRAGADAFMDEVIERLADAIGDHRPEVLETQPRGGFSYHKPALGLVEWMPAMELGRRVGVKTVGYHPSNPAERRLPSVYANTTLYDTTTGRLTAICDSTMLTAIRTGAASAIATDILAIDGSVRLGVIGCGAQAVTQIHAISRVRTVTEVVAFDADADVAATLADRVGAVVPGVRIRIADDAGAVARAVDVLCTVTSVDIGAGPVFADDGLRDWLHVNAVGADFPGKTEVPLSTLRRAAVFPDYPPQCVVEGEAQQLDPAELDVDFPSLVARRAEFRDLRGRLTVFDSTGWAVEDLIAADVAFEHAERLGVGREIELHHDALDPFSPYESLLVGATQEA
ncbi:MAG: ornithine cyclodeaminase family protein [Actinomycetota bacterium]